MLSWSRFLVVFAIFLIVGHPTQVLSQQRPSESTGPETLASQHAPMASPARIRSAQSQAFLEDLERRSFRYFWEQADPNTGLVLDRTRTDGTPTDENHRVIASIAATGFGLTAICIASERRWIPRAAARQRVRNTLSFFAERALHEHGWFYHWMDYKTGERKWKSEISSIDTALLLAGILTAKQYFHEDAAIARFATRIYERIDFPWMLNKHPTLLAMGWHPETGFIKARWDNYSEHPILYLMAIGSPTHPLRPNSWYAWERNWNEYRGYRYLGKTPLFTYQYSHAWVDFRNRREERGEKIDYFLNSVHATLAHRLFCMELAGEFPAYGPDMWGISASDSAKGYVAWGGPPRDPAIDGTVVPYVAAGSLMFVPEHGLTALQNMKRKYGNRIYGKYGFTDAFNPNTGWVNSDVIGIDLGITILGAENARTGNVWRWFMRNPEITKAMELVGLRKSDQLLIHPNLLGGARLWGLARNHFNGFKEWRSPYHGSLHMMSEPNDERRKPLKWLRCVTVAAEPQPEGWGE